MESIKMGSVCFDKHAKELVKITNGIGADASATGEFIPTEAIAIRCVGVTQKGLPSLAFTYRGVEPKNLSLAEGAREAFESAMALIKVRV